MGIEKAKVILDRALQRCQEYNWKDWSEPAVEKLILDVKSALNEYEAPARIETQADRNDEIEEKVRGILTKHIDPLKWVDENTKEICYLIEHGDEPENLGLGK